MVYRIRVSPTDTSNGKEELCSVEYIDEALLQAKKEMSEANEIQDINVEFSPGTYVLHQPIIINESALEGQTITLQGSKSGRAVLTSASEVSGWQLHDKAKNIWVCDVPEGTSFDQLWINGEKKAIANSGANPKGLRHLNNKIRFNPKHFDLENLKKELRLSVKVNAFGIWRMSEHRISRWEGNTAYYDFPFWVDKNIPVDIGRTFFHIRCTYFIDSLIIENAYVFLNQSNEWYLDTTSNKLYYIPDPAEAFDKNTTAVYANTPCLLVLNGTDESPISDITVDNLHFRQTESVFGYHYTPCNNAELPVPHMGCLQVNWGENITIVNSSFKHLGSSAIWFDGGSNHASVHGNAFQHIRGKAINFVQSDVPILYDYDIGPVERLSGKYHKDVHIKNNYIRDIDDPLAVNTTELVDGLLVEHNDIARTKGFAIKVNWWKNYTQGFVGKVEYAWNRVADGGHSDDTGLLYISGCNRVPALVHHNFADSINVHPSCNAFYFDLSSSKVKMYNNVNINSPANSMISTTKKFPFVKLNMGGWVGLVDTEGVIVSNNWTESTRSAQIRFSPPYLYKSYKNRFVKNVKVKRGTPLDIWPLEAQEVINGAGLEPDFTNLPTLLDDQ